MSPSDAAGDWAEKPIFLQTLWRSRGTYFWSLFRKDPRYRAYIEPLHEGLEWKKTADWEREFNNGLAAGLRHPKIEQHYFAEYPILQQGGTPLYRPGFGYQQFALRADDKHDELVEYLTSLIAYARDHGQRPLFKFTRAGLRSAFLASRFDALQLYLNRPAPEICASYRSFGPNSYFLTALIYVLACNPRALLFPELRDKMAMIGSFDLPVLNGKFAEDFHASALFTAGLNDRQVKLLVAGFWMLYLFECASVADVIIDTERLATELPYKKDMSDRFRELLASDAPFSDFHATSVPYDFEEIEPDLREVVSNGGGMSRLWSGLPVGRLETLGSNSRRLLDNVL